MATLIPSVAALAGDRGPAASWRRSAVVGTVVLAIIAALGASATLPSRSLEPELVLVIRFMALVKAAIAVLAVAAVWWRAASPLSIPTFAGALLAVAAMAAAPVLVWQGTALGVSSLAFQGGLLGLAGLAVAEHRALRKAGRGSPGAG